MARQFAPLYTSIWQDDVFVNLPAQSQRVYLLAVSQPNITWCGVVPFTAKRWASFAPDTTPRAIVRAVGSLTAADLVLLDDDTEELWVRSFIKHNVVNQPKLREAAKREYRDIHSRGIRLGIAKAYPWASGTPAGAHADDCVSGVGVEVQCSSNKPTTNTQHSHAVVDTTFADAIRREAERQLADWKRSGAAIIDDEDWLGARVAKLAGRFEQIGLDNPEASVDELVGLFQVRTQGKQPAHLRVVCANKDCREGYDVIEEQPCAVCEAKEDVA